MRKEFRFIVKAHTIRVVNTWTRGIKLYVDGDFRDQDTSFFVNGKAVLLSAKLGEYGILEIYLSAFTSVEIDAYLVLNNSKQYVFSSHKHLSLTEQRLAKQTHTSA